MLLHKSQTLNKMNPVLNGEGLNETSHQTIKTTLKTLGILSNSLNSSATNCRQLAHHGGITVFQITHAVNPRSIKA